MKNEIDERMLDLLCDKALFGLSEEELRELAEFEATAGPTDEDLMLELTAARLSTIGSVEGAELPEHLFEKIVRDSKGHVLTEENVFTARRAEPPRDGRGPGMFGWLGWAAAAAACIALAIMAYDRPESPLVADGPRPSPTLQQELTPALLRQQLIDTGQVAVRAEWGKGNLPQTEEISGDVVWSDDRQTGYMRIKGLPVNDRTREQYQLWIFEDAKLEAHPKDGGVFDISSDGEVIVPIDAKLLTRDPKAFAITIEKPGGTVVSERDKIAALAAVKPSSS